MCGCDQRREMLNMWIPGLGDKVASIAEPVKAMVPHFVAGVALAAIIAWGPK